MCVMARGFLDVNKFGEMLVQKGRKRKNFSPGENRVHGIFLRIHRIERVSSLVTPKFLAAYNLSQMKYICSGLRIA